MKTGSLTNSSARARAWLAGPLLSMACLFAASAGAQDTDADARAILKAMSDYVGAQQSIDFSFDSDIEVITPELEKIQFTSSGSALLSRPDKLYAHRVGGYADVALYFNGKTASVYGKSLNGYATIDAPGTVDQLIDALRQGHGVALPGMDFLHSNSYERLVADVLEAKHIGRGVVEGVECEHLAFRNFDTDWQVWIDVGDKPMPRKLVITSKTINSAPQYTFRMKTWKTGVATPASAFTLEPPAGAAQLDPNALIDLDELPPEAPAGDRK